MQFLSSYGGILSCFQTGYNVFIFHDNCNFGRPRLLFDLNLRPCVTPDERKLAFIFPMSNQRISVELYRNYWADGAVSFPFRYDFRLRG